MLSQQSEKFFSQQSGNSSLKCMLCENMMIANEKLIQKIKKMEGLLGYKNPTPQKTTPNKKRKRSNSNSSLPRSGLKFPR